MMPSWSPDGSWLYFSSNRTGREEVWKMPAAGQAGVQLTHGGGFNPIAAPDGRTVYFLRSEKELGLWSVSTDGRAETRVIETNPEQEIDITNWAVTVRGIYFLEGKRGETYTLEFFDFDTRRTTPLTTLGGPNGTFVILGLTVAPDESSVLYAERDKFDLDLMLVEDFH
jgi:Tol biopolymer transport system component